MIKAYLRAGQTRLAFDFVRQRHVFSYPGHPEWFRMEEKKICAVRFGQAGKQRRGKDQRNLPQYPHNNAFSPCGILWEFVAGEVHRTDPAMLFATYDPKTTICIKFVEIAPHFSYI